MRNSILNNTSENIEKDSDLRLQSPKKKQRIVIPSVLASKKKASNFRRKNLKPHVELSLDRTLSLVSDVAILMRQTQGKWTERAKNDETVNSSQQNDLKVGSLEQDAVSKLLSSRNLPQRSK